MLFHKFREVVEARSWKELVLPSEVQVRQCSLPMANVKKANPNNTPAYPSSGRIYMISCLEVPIYSSDIEPWYLNRPPAMGQE